MTVAEVLARLEGVKKCGAGWTARCPSHDDRTNSLSVSEASGRVLLHCHAGCTAEKVCTALRIELKDLFIYARDGNSHPPPSLPNSRLTLQQFADAKGFDVDFLTTNGVSEEKGGLVFHYLLMNGQRA